MSIVCVRLRPFRYHQPHYYQAHTSLCKKRKKKRGFD